MTENELTIPELQPLNATEMATDDYNGLNTLLYVIRGLDADRDRKMTFAEFSAVIGQLFKSLKVYTAEGQKSVTIQNGEISASNIINRMSFVLSWLGFKIDGDGFTFRANNDDGLKFTQEGASFKACETYFEYAKGDDKIYFNADGFKVYKNENVTFEIKNGVTTPASLNVKALDVSKFVDITSYGEERVVLANLTAFQNANIGDVIYVKTGPNSKICPNVLTGDYIASNGRVILPFIVSTVITQTEAVKYITCLFQPTFTSGTLPDNS